MKPVPSLQFTVCAAARSLGRCINGKTVCRIFNPNPFSVVLRKGMRLASIHTTDVIVSCSPYKESKPCKQIPRRILNKQSDAQLETFAGFMGLQLTKI